MPDTAAAAAALWRRAIQALAHAFDPAHEADDHSTVFQTAEARARSESRDAADAAPRRDREPEQTLQ